MNRLIHRMAPSPASAASAPRIRNGDARMKKIASPRTRWRRARAHARRDREVRHDLRHRQRGAQARRERVAAPARQAATGGRVMAKVARELADLAHHRDSEERPLPRDGARPRCRARNRGRDRGVRDRGAAAAGAACSTADRVGPRALPTPVGWASPAILSSTTQAALITRQAAISVRTAFVSISTPQ